MDRGDNARLADHDGREVVKLIFGLVGAAGKTRLASKSAVAAVASGAGSNGGLPGRGPQLIESPGPARVRTRETALRPGYWRAGAKSEILDPLRERPVLDKVHKA